MSPYAPEPLTHVSAEPTPAADLATEEEPGVEDVLAVDDFVKDLDDEHFEDIAEPSKPHGHFSQVPLDQTDPLGVSDQVATDLEALARPRSEIPSYLHQVGRYLKEIGADLKEIGADLKVIGADLKEIGADLKEIGADLKEIAADRTLACGDLKAVPTDQRLFTGAPP